MKTVYVITIAERQGDKFVYPIISKHSTKKAAEQALTKLQPAHFICTELQYDFLYDSK